MEAVAADAPVVAPALAVPRRSRPRPAWWRGTRCRRRRRAERRQQRSAPRRSPRARARCGAARARASSSIAARTLGVDHNRLDEACAAVDDAVRDRADLRRRCLRDASTASDRVSSSSTTRSLRLVEPGVDDEDRGSRASSGQVQSRISGSSSPCSRVYARAREPRVRPSPGEGARRSVAKSGHAVDHVDDEVEAVEVVEHDHVERRRRRALFLVAAHVQVRVVGAAVGEPVDQPRIAVVGEDDRPVAREERVELARRTGRADARSPAGGASGRRR